MYTRAFFLIEGGAALTMVKARIAELNRVHDEVAALAASYGITKGTKHRRTGVLLGCFFEAEAHPEFTKPNRKGVCRPKLNTASHKLFQAQVGYTDECDLVMSALNVPDVIDYKHSGDDHGLATCFPGEGSGILYMSEAGPYAMWMPDVPAEVAELTADGCEVQEPAKSFKLEFEGCSRIEEEDWEILVLQHELAETVSAKASKSLLAVPAAQTPAAAGLERTP